MDVDMDSYFDIMTTMEFVGKGEWLNGYHTEFL